MADDPVRVLDTRRWLEIAQKDLSRVRRALVEPSDTEDAVFHCQQAVEKALKAFLVWHDEPFPRSHDLQKLGEKCVQIDNSLDHLVGRAIYLTDYAVEYRYPTDLTEPTLDAAGRALGLAEEMLAAILFRLPKQFRSS